MMRLTSLRLKPETRYKRLTIWFGQNIKFTASGIKLACSKTKLVQFLAVHKVLFKHLCRTKPHDYGGSYEPTISDEQLAAL